MFASWVQISRQGVETQNDASLRTDFPPKGPRQMPEATGSAGELPSLLAVGLEDGIRRWRLVRGKVKAASEPFSFLALRFALATGNEWIAARPSTVCR